MKNVLKWLTWAEQREREAQDARVEAGKALRAARQREGVGLAEFAQRLGISMTYLCDVERGRRRVSDLLRERVAELASRKDMATAATVDHPGKSAA